MPVLQVRVPSVGHEDDILLDVLLHHEPRASAQSQPLALAYGVKPESFVASQHLSRFDVDDASFLFAHELADEVIVVNLAQETDALAVLAVCAGQVCIKGYATHLLLHQMPDGEERVAQLRIVELRQEVRLVLDGVTGCTQPYRPLLVLDGGGVVTCGYLVVVVTDALLKGSELDEPVAHHVRVGREPLPDAVDGISHHQIPVFLLQVGDFQCQPVFAGGGLAQFNVLFCRARRILALHTYFNIM